MVIVTMTGEPFKRYAVVPEDEHMFDGLDGVFDDGSLDYSFHFGAQALRPSGVDESYRLLSSDRMTKVTRR